MNELKYASFSDIHLLVSQACENQNRKMPIARTLRHWLDNDNDKQVVHVRKYKTRYNVQDAIQMLYTDHHIAISADTQKEYNVQVQSKLMQKYQDNSELQAKIHKEMQDLKFNLVLNVILKNNGYSGFNETMMLNDLLLTHTDGHSMEKGDAIANTQNANTRRYLIKKRGNK